MLRLWLFIFLLTLLSCGQQGGGTALKVTTAGINNHLAGDLYLLAHNPEQDLFMREKIVTDPQTFSFPNGTWRFHVVFYEGGHTNEPRCGSELRTLDGNPVDLSISVTRANCRLAPYTASSFLSGGGTLQAVKLQSCSQMPDAFGGSCESGEQGATVSYRVVIPNYTFSKISTPTIKDSGFVSTCITGFNPTTGGSTNHFLLPGSVNLPFGFMIRSFSDTNCTGTMVEHHFHQGLATPNSISRAVWSNASVEPIIYILHSTASNFGTVANDVLLPAESNYPIDIARLLVNGTPPYNISVTGGGTMSGTKFINNGNEEPKTFTITDANSNTTTLTVYPILGSSNDFTTKTAPGWSTTRAGPSQVTQTTATAFNPATDSTVRFGHIGSNNPIGLLIEPGRMNLMPDHSNVSSWINESSSPVTATTTTSELSGASAQSTLTDGATGGATPVATFVSSPLGLSLGVPYVFSVFVKNSNMNFSRISISEATTPCADVIFNSMAMTAMTSPTCTLGGSGIIPVNSSWSRVWMRITSNSMSGPRVRISPAWSSTLSPNSTGTANGSLTIWGMQLEQGLFPTSPILTTGTSTARPADDVVRTTDLPQRNLGTILLRWSGGLDTATASTLLHLNSSPMDANNRIQLTKTASNTLQLTIAGSTIKTLNQIGSLKADGTTNSVAFSYNSAQLSMVVNNSANFSSTTMAGTDIPPANFAQMYLGSYDGSLQPSWMSAHRYHYWSGYFIPEVLEQIIEQQAVVAVAEI